MGMWTTILGFGAGYVVGAKRGSEPIDRLQERARTMMGGEGGRGTVDVREVREIMTAVPETVSPDTPLVEAAKLMRDGDMGDVLVVEHGNRRLTGIVTDRDVAIRAVAEGRDPATTTVGSVASRDLTTLAPTDTVQEAISRMRSADVRRLPVVEAGVAIGIVSLGDVSLEADAGSALADISAAAPDR